MRLLQSLLNYVLPIHCYLCDQQSEELICKDCTTDFLLTSDYRCRACGITLMSIDQHKLCGACIKNPPHFDQTIVATDYLPPVDQLVQRFKFGHQLMLADLMARCIRDAIITQYQGELPDLLTPVPLNAIRLIERGFNQAQEIGKGLAPQIGIKLEPRLLIRIKQTQAQSSLAFKQRQTNTLHAFTCNLNEVKKIQNQHIGVIDDVMTTGTTLNEIAKTLKRHGARTVTNFVFARTPKQA